ncbi:MULTISPECIES: hypothetical protein [unclassified Spirosoma]|uniref:hypothetical protein n=1 Tax=unclassified Spirosoma TaxID=2621999 RepID=UPI000965C83A|nr:MULTISPECIES: hypothetical protein [unclassified Spirosoma]MBN8825302.1 hypothetical protein [Spirosoma sp.]OJW77525.1 MAG: hypothetical protein BGO59_01280 [Spirosoma sp. 48-14]
MNRNTALGFVLIGFAVGNCQKIQQSQLTRDAQLMATLECEARQLKNERFKAANDIRFMEDSLAKHSIRLTSAQSAQIDSVKANYTLRTGQLAEKITKTMDSLYTATYHQPDERQQLDDAVEKVLQTICH